VITDYLKFPAVYFGGKSSITDVVWQALGSPKRFMEPFCGSAAVLLARPNFAPGDMHEIINDKDGFICNVWRALKYNPDAVAEWCDWPVNHIDLNSRRRELVKAETELVKNLTNSTEFYDAKLAGFWIWAASCWIGSGLTCLNAIPPLGDAGQGIHAMGQRPHLTDAGKGIHAMGQIPHLSHAGQGIHAMGKRPYLSNAGKVNDPINANLWTWFRALQERLRYVAVTCGDWKIICGGNWQDKIGDVGIFFDPPYGDTDRDVGVYHHDSTALSAEVEAWCLKRGKLKTHRIVVCGYDTEYKDLQADGWRVQAWKTGGGYGNTQRVENQDQGKTRGQLNRHREIILFSPYCIKPNQKELFEES